MSLAQTRTLIDAAVATGVAVPAFNVISLEHAEAIAWGAERAGIGAILQVSENAIRFHNNRFEPLLAACHELALASTHPLAIHLDHIESRSLAGDLIAAAADFGIGSIMIDASTLDYRLNVELTAEVADEAHAVGLWVEAELGEVGGKDGAHAPGVRTDPGEAARFVAETRVDGLAVAVGSSHAMTERSAAIDLPLVESLARRVPVPLVLHGSSGVPDVMLGRAVRAGIRKVNIGTALNVVSSTALRASLAGQPTAVDPRRFSALPREAMTQLVAHLCAVVSSGVEAGRSAHPEQSTSIAAVDALECGGRKV